MDRDRPRLTARAGWTVAGIVPAAFLAVFFALPVVTIVARGASVDALVDMVTDDHLRAVAWFTLWQAVASTVLTIAVALPIAWVLARYRFRGRSLVWALVTVPFVLPTVVVASAFLALLRPYDLVPSMAAVLAAHVFFNVAVVARTVGNALSTLDPALDDAARMLGASRWRAFREVSLPLVRPALVAASSIVFLFTFTSFGIVLMLGGPRRATLDVEIWKQTAFFLDLETAAGLSLVQLLAVVACVGAAARLQARVVPRRQRDSARSLRGGRERLAVGGVVGTTLAFLLAPLAVVVHRSFDTATGPGLAFYRALGTSRQGSTLFIAPEEAIANSILFGVVATALALVVGGMAGCVIAYRSTRASRLLDLVVMIPLGTSAVTVGLGFLLALDEPPLDLRGWRWLVPVAHALIAIPFVVRIVVPAVRTIDPRLREAAATLGASPRRARWEIDVPLASRAVLVAAGFSFALSLGEFGATVFLARPDRPTMPIAIFRYLGQPGTASFGQAMAMSTILLVVTVVVIAAIERFRVGDSIV